ncbi:MAG: diguanylate cyclase, partial [Oscillospiraceae bacterium]|nr:diguanylate cyclase [Oscillospiraceae bacterium]
MRHDVYIIEETEELAQNIKNIFKSKSMFKFKSVKVEDVEEELRNIPDLIIINEDTIKPDAVKLCKTIRSDEDNSITPIIVISSDLDSEHKIKIIKNQVEYYIEKPVNEEMLRYTIENITRLLYVNRRISPLTGLPGNVQIQAELKKRLRSKKAFEVLYFDLDNFKAYNDVYGFLAGDEIIKLTSRIIAKNVQNLDASDVFTGHIGGDDFVVIVSENVDYEKICQNIIAEFDSQKINYFNDDDVERGYLEVQNRKGEVEQFPLTSISIGVVVADKKRFANILEIAENGAQVKCLAKTTMGSSYAIDRRDSSGNA